MSNNKILIPLNQSESSRRVLASVERLFPPAGNDLILYFVTRPPSPAGFGEADLASGYALPGDEPVKPTLHPIYESQQRDSIKAHVRSELLPETRRLREAGYAVEVKVGFSNNPVDSIQRYLREVDASLIAMTTRARVGVTRFFFKNIADTIAEKTGVPVLQVYPGGD